MTLSASYRGGPCPDRSVASRGGGSVLVFELLVRPSVNRGHIHNLKILYTCMNPINGA